MTAPAPVTPAPDFILHGEITPALVSALARLLIARAKRELEMEAAQAGDGDQQGGERT